MKLRHTLIIFSSKRDINGNTYHAFRFIDHMTGKVVEGSDVCESNVNAIRFDFRGKGTGWDEGFIMVNKEMGIREYQRATKDFKYIGSDTETLRKHILDELTKPVGFKS